MVNDTANAVYRSPRSLPGIDRRLERVASLLRKQIFFIVGCQKSGTTWVKLIVDGHPTVFCRSEAYLGGVLAPAIAQTATLFNERLALRGDGGRMDEDSVRVLQLTAAGLLFDHWIGETPIDLVQCLGDKTPEHALCLAALDELFPGMRVIHVIRDGRDVAVSGWFHNVRQHGDAFRAKYPDLPSYIEYIVRAHWRPYIMHARRFGVEHPDRFHEVRYEDLHAEPETSAAALLEFLGVDDGPEDVAGCLEAGAFQRQSAGRPRGVEDRDSFFRKGVVGDWREHFDDRAHDAFMTHGGDLLAELGYATSL